MNIRYIKDVSLVKPELLEEKFGKWGIELWNKAQGIHNGEVTNYQEAKSISSENTFDENLADEKQRIAELFRMTEKIAHALRQEEKVAGLVAVKIRYADFETTSRQTTIPYSAADDEFFPVVKDLFKKLYKRGELIRLAGVRLSELTNEAIQANLFSNVEKKSILYKAIDDVKNRFGKTSLKRASSHRK